MKNKIKIYKDTDKLSQFFAQKIAREVSQMKADEFYTIALSGGSTPRKVFEYIALHFKTQIEWHKVLVFWSDERCVNPLSDESNYKMARESLLDKVPIPANNIFRVFGEADPYAESVRYSEIISKKVKAKNNIPQFDLMMLGLGEDGHTASIFLGSQHLFNSDKLCEVAVNPYSKQNRITVTGKIINNSRTVLFLVTGGSKAEKVAQIIERKEGWDKLPASMVNPSQGELIWLLDEKAAGKLSKAADSE